ncbi:hypothetical protein [Nitratireductor sp. CH_MIT9313-5]|jgi:hypothetical protein|uniref:hypothetical protein n=1 Tax=Nitratireductor sp. CH_MIT9313-5 TaxID=3107764 RepID=UPI0030092AD4
MHKFSITLLTLAGLGLSTVSALSWDQMAGRLKEQCLSSPTVRDAIHNPRIWVDTRGSQNFSYAIVGGDSKHSRDEIGFICIYDKAKEKMEISGELHEDDLDRIF